MDRHGPAWTGMDDQRFDALTGFVTRISGRRSLLGTLLLPLLEAVATLAS